MDGTEQLEVVQPAGSGGTTKRATAGQIAALAGIYNYLLTPQSVFGNPTSTATAGTSIVGSAEAVFRYDASGQIGFGSINLATSVAVAGILPVVNGGIGTSTLDSGTVLLGRGTASISPLPNVTAGYVLTANGTALSPSWQLGGGLSAQAGLSVLGVTGNATATPAGIAGTVDQVLRVDANGTALTFGQVNLSATAAITGFLSTGFVTGIVAVPRGGTGTSALTAFGVMLGNGTAAVTLATAGAAGQIFVAQGTASQASFNTVTGDLSVNLSASAAVVTAAITYPKIQQFVPLSVLANSSSATTISTAVAGTANQVLIINPAGTGLGFGQVNLSSTGAITGTLGSSYFNGILSVPFGGSGTSALTAFGLVAGNGTSAVQIVTAGSAGQILIAQTTTSLAVFVAATGDVLVGAAGTHTIVTAAITFPKFQQMVAVSVHANPTSVTAISTSVAGTASQVLIVNDAGTGLLFGQINLSVTGSVTGFLNVSSYATGVLQIGFGGTAATSQPNAIINLKGLALNTTGQAFTGGVVLTALNLGTVAASTLTLVAGNPPIQRVINNGTAAIVAPSSDCEIDLWVTNAGSASTISFSGFSVGSNTGDTYATAVGKYIFQSRTANGSSTYAWKALQ